jgi:hypothetical protein
MTLRHIPENLNSQTTAEVSESLHIMPFEYSSAAYPRRLIYLIIFDEKLASYYS